MRRSITAGMQPLRVAVIGAGSHSRQCHGPAIRLAALRLPHLCRPVAVCDLQMERAEKFAAEFGFERAYGSCEEMLEKETIDAIFAITPISATFEIVSRLLPLKIPVLIEKPAGSTPEEAGRLVSIARRARTLHMVSFNRRFSPAVAKANVWLSRRHPQGLPVFITGTMMRHNRREPDFIQGTAIHAVDLLFSFLGTPRQVSARLAQEGPAYAIDVSLAFRGGRAGRLLVAPDSGTVRETYEIVGDGCSVFIDTAGCSVRIRDRRIPVLDWKAAPRSHSCVKDGTYGETVTFLTAVRTRRQPRPDLADAYQAMRACATIARQVARARKEH